MLCSRNQMALLLTGSMRGGGGMAKVGNVRVHRKPESTGRIPAVVSQVEPVRCPAGVRGGRSAVFTEQAWQTTAQSLKLSLRELQIIRAMFDYKKEYSIAADLGISPHTVHTHLERLHRKLGIADRTQLLVCIVTQFLRLTTAPGSALPPICTNRAAGRCPFQA